MLNETFFGIFKHRGPFANVEVSEANKIFI